MTNFIKNLRKSPINLPFSSHFVSKIQKLLLQSNNSKIETYCFNYETRNTQKSYI